MVALIRRSVSLAAMVLTAAMVPDVADAQVLGLPVVNNGFASGMSVAADVGLANDAGGGGTAVGGHLTFGTGLLALTASISRADPALDQQPVWSSGGAATLRLFGGPLVPFRLTAQAGAAAWDPGPTTRQLHVPLSIGLSATIPNPMFAIRPWLAPRLDLVRTTVNGVGSTETELGISGGIELGFINGLRVRAAYDRLFGGGDPGVLAFGLGYAFGR
jgi:hypothetical protein